MVVVEAALEWEVQTAAEYAEDEEQEQQRKALTARRAALNRKRTALYRLFDITGVLLYIGITANPPERFKEHRTEKDWWPEVTSKKTEWFDSRREAETAEIFAIVAEYPRYNVSWAGLDYRRHYLDQWVRARVRELPRRSRVLARLDQHEVPEPDWWLPRLPPRRIVREHLARGIDLHFDDIEPVLPAQRLVDDLRQRHGECGRCRAPYPCAVTRKIAAQFSGHPQYAALWGGGIA